MSAALEETEEAARFAADLRRVLEAVPRVWERPPAETRRANREGQGPFGAPAYSPRGVWRTAPGRNGSVRLRVLLPASGTVRRVYLRIHGGGWVLGAPDGGELALQALADASETAVVSVTYRLAPEHPFPQGLEDCLDAAEWLVETSRSEFGVDIRAIGGESAGAHLSVLTLLHRRDHHGATGFHAANLLYGCYDLGGTPSLVNWGADNLILDTPTVFWFREQLLQGACNPRSPRVSPLFADLRGLPPALFTVGSLDPLLDDTLLMHRRWVEAGNAAELALYPGAVHAFDAFDLAIANRARATVAGFLAGVRSTACPAAGDEAAHT